ncbi:MAG: hypothetical protein E7656_00905 [Ruminococcaceae bacterium]|nr:hypothetical protein [Oscillospiraceae bacterium]
MKHISEIMFSIITNEIFSPVEKVSSLTLSDEQAQKLYALSKKHDVTHIIGQFLLKNNIPLSAEAKKAFEKYTFTSLRYFENLNYELSALVEFLEEEKTPYIPLKGSSVIRDLYPQPWLRSSRDIDILVPENDTERIVKKLIDERGYTKQRENTHDISLKSPSGVNVEIHFTLVEDGIAKESSAILSSVWESSASTDKNYLRKMSDEMYYYYHIAHMAKHFEEGGCGVRPFIDLLLLDLQADADAQKRNELLEKGGLLTFAKASRKLAHVWFCGAEKDEITSQMEEYILRGGSFGTNVNRVNVQQQKKGGKLYYAFAKVFTPYEKLKHYYPILKKHKWLMPFMQVRRWFKLIFCGHLGRTTAEMKYSMNIAKDDAKAMEIFLKNIGL